MSAHSDFTITIDRAAGLALDAACSARAARTVEAPAPHRRLLNTAINSLERAQDALFEARRTSWDERPKVDEPQLTLV